MRKLLIIPVLAVLGLALAAPVSAAPPSRTPAIYADGTAYATKFNTLLPAPTAHNVQSYDKLFTFAPGAHPDQLAVAEAAPGPGFNGGRWISYTVEWDDDVVDPPLLTSDDDVAHYESLGDLEVTQGHAAGGPAYFLCPLFPVK